MRIRTILLLLIGITVYGSFQMAFGNGRTTPQTMDTSPLTALCSQRGGEQIEIFRVRVIDRNGSEKALTVAIEDVTQTVVLSEITLLTFRTTKISADGFMKATLSRSDGTEASSAMVRVRSGTSVIRLTGFRSNGTSVSVDLSKCRSVAFSPIGKDAGGSKYRPATAD